MCSRRKILGITGSNTETRLEGKNANSWSVLQLCSHWTIKKLRVVEKVAKKS